MDAQELRNLQEAYMEVVMNELDEGYKELPVDKMVAKSKSLTRKPKEPGAPRWGRDDERASNIRKTAGTHNRAKVKKVEKTNRERGIQTEDYDLYDIILSHLLDEGYAETSEAAEAIMVNMSEDWRDDIVEEFLDERNRGERGMSDREVTRRRNLGGNVRSKVSASSLGDHGPQSAIQKFHKTKANQRRAIHKSGRYTRGDTGESGGQGRYQANKDHTDGYPSITKRGDGPY